MVEQRDLIPVAKAICDREGLTLGERLGSGGFKEVFRVTDQDQEDYALKVLYQGPDELMQRRSKREVETMLKCNHPNIARIVRPLSSHSLAGHEYAYFLEEYLPGQTLGFRLQAGLLAASDIQCLARALVDAICYLESLDLVHRDIKPDNIMFRHDGTPVLVDFNIVRDLRAASLTQSWLPSGPATAYFAAPEQLTNEKSLIDWRTDQFLVGLVLCYAFTGYHPYQHPGDTPIETINRVASRGARNTEVLGNCTTAGFGVLDRMTQPWPIHRFRTTELLVEAWNN